MAVGWRDIPTTGRIVSSETMIVVLLLASASLDGGPLVCAGDSSFIAYDNEMRSEAPINYSILADTSVLAYSFRAAVDAGQESQPFFFTVPAGISVFIEPVYLSADLVCNPLRSGACDLELSLWDSNGLRTGGKLRFLQATDSSIAYSTYIPSPEGAERIEVAQVLDVSEGLWKALVFCPSSSAGGARFDLTVTIMLSEELVPSTDGKSFEFSVASNVRNLEAVLAPMEGHDFDISVWDGFGRRTGGRTSEFDEDSSWIPNSHYFGHGSSPERITVTPVTTTDLGKNVGELWRVCAHSADVSSAGNYAISIEMVFDSDGDGAVDQDDIDPVHDLCLRLLVTNLRQLDPIDSGDNKWDPHVRLGIGETMPDQEPLGGPGDAWGSHLWSSSIQPIQLNGDFTGEYSMWKNVPDTSRTVSLFIQVRDDDGPDDDLCDISPVKSGGVESNARSCTLYLDYDLVTEEWTGDVSSGRSSGESDGSAGSLGTQDENDAEILFTITTVWEMSFTEKVYLANIHAPLLFLDEGEDSGPLEVWSMLNQSDLKSTSTRKTMAQHPLSDVLLSKHRTGSYMRLVERDLQHYRNQIYANVFTSDNDTIVIQYWFFYLYDSVSPHQGDWEMIQVIFAEGSRFDMQGYLSPSRLVYSQHFGGDTRDWNDSEAQRTDTHPWVFVELGGHASVFSGPEGSGIMYPVTVMSPWPWLNFTGKWGSSRWKIGPGGVSVPGPVFRASMNRNWLGKPTSPIAYMWHEPLHWAEEFQ